MMSQRSLLLALVVFSALVAALGCTELKSPNDRSTPEVDAGDGDGDGDGDGFLESVYEQAMSVELGIRGIPFARQVPITVTYKSIAISDARLDFLVADCVVIELKACADLLPIHLAQVLSYLKASDHSLALLINFNVALLRQGVRRVIRTG